MIWQTRGKICPTSNSYNSPCKIIPQHPCVSDKRNYCHVPLCAIQIKTPALGYTLTLYGATGTKTQLKAFGFQRNQNPSGSLSYAYNHIFISYRYFSNVNIFQNNERNITIKSKPATLLQKVRKYVLYSLNKFENKHRTRRQ